MTNYLFVSYHFIVYMEQYGYHKLSRPMLNMLNAYIYMLKVFYVNEVIHLFYLCYCILYPSPVLFVLLCKLVEISLVKRNMIT